MKVPKRYLIVALLILVALGVLFIPILTTLKPRSFGHTRLNFSNPPPDPIQVLPADLSGFDPDYIHTLYSQPEQGREVITLSKEKNPAGIKDIKTIVPYVIQLGSFSEKENAQRLSLSLQAAGYPAFMMPAKESADSAHWQVWVGPFLEQNAAEAALVGIQQKIEVEGLIILYTQSVKSI
ncbi:MAG: Sporulation-like protein [Gammaproteobacteria bacterium]|jgi:cell division septation protein DedD|nr:Sporulation-like protein [Gammaproteobacteria bacterium]